MTFQDLKGDLGWGNVPGTTMRIGKQIWFGRWDGGIGTVVFHENTRRDEDPRHKWNWDPSNRDTLWHCDRCGRGFIETWDEWVRTFIPEWPHVEAVFSKMDPRRRTQEQAREEFESINCEGERRKREEWGL